MNLQPNDTVTLTSANRHWFTVWYRRVRGTPLLNPPTPGRRYRVNRINPADHEGNPQAYVMDDLPQYADRTNVGWWIPMVYLTKETR